MAAPESTTVSRSAAEVHYQPLVMVLVAVAGGILLDRNWPLPLGMWWIMASGGLAVWLVLLRRQRIAAAGVVLLLAMAAVAGAWHHCRWHLFCDDDLGRYARCKAQPVCVEVVASSAPRSAPPQTADPMQAIPRDDLTRLDVEVAALRNGANWQPASGRATLTVQGEPPAINVGDRLRCFVQLRAPPVPQNPGVRDRSAYLRAERIRSQLVAESPECLAVVSPGSPWSFGRMLGWLRMHGRRVLKGYLNPEQAELASAVLLGLREELDYERNEAFLTTGTIHILSISGLHIGILAGAMFWMMRRTPIRRGWAIVVIALITVLYTLTVDAEPPVVRSTVLVLITCGSLALWRRPLGMNSLAAAALVVLIVNPAHLFDVGAQLSFLCVAILIWFEGWRPRAEDESKKVRRTLERLVWRNRPWWERRLRSFWRSIVGLTMVGVVIWLLTLPLVVARFHIFSIVALGLNAILWIPMTLSVLSGFCLLIAGSICPPLAYVCGGVCDLSFWLLEKGVNLAHRMPYSHFWIPGPAEWWLWIFYGGLGLLLAFPAVRLRRRWCAVLLVAWIAVGLTAACWPRERDRLDCTFLSMGHGCAVVLELPSGRTMLYDAGQFGSPSAGAGAISEFLWHRGIRRLDVVILSHPDLDHYNALPRLLDKFSVGEVVVSSAMFRKNNAAVAALRDAIKEHGISVREVHDGEYVGGGDGCVLQVLHPPRYGLPESTNANSIVLSVGYLGARILLLGDLESSGLSRVLSQEPQPCAVLLAPHHGSRKSNPPDLARWCLPRWVVFSGDGRWSIPEGESPYRAVGSRVLHTHNSGAIFATIDASGVRLSHFLQSQR